MSHSAISMAQTPPPCRACPPNCLILRKILSSFSGCFPWRGVLFNPWRFLLLSYRPACRTASSQRIYAQNKNCRLTNRQSFESFGHNERLPPAGTGDSTRLVCRVVVFLRSEVIFYEHRA